MKYTPRLPEDNVNVTPSSPLREFVILAGGLLAIGVGIYIILGVAVDFIVPRLSTEMEKKLGHFVLQTFEESPNESEKAAALQTLLNDLHQRCTKLPYHFNIVLSDSPAVNALALPGGSIVVFTGLLGKVTSENELAFVLAHEMGHYAHRDHLRGMGRALVFMVLNAVLFGSDSGIGNMLGSALSITEMRFSRAQETRADEFAIETIACTYGHVGGATDFFTKIGEAEDPGVFGHYFATHPENNHRIAHLQKYAVDRGLKAASTRSLPEPLL